MLNDSQNLFFFAGVEREAIKKIPNTCEEKELWELYRHTVAFRM